MTDAELTDTIVCPRGHEIPNDQVLVRDGYRVCPVCETEAPWAAAHQPLPWSRRLLRGPLLLIAGGLLVAAIASAFHVAEAVSYVNNHLPGSSAGLTGTIVEMLGDLVLAAAVVWVATLVGTRE